MILPPSLITKNVFYALGLSALLLLVSDPALALNVEKIGKSLAGSDRQKMILLKDIAFYTGAFFAVLGAIVTVFRKRKFALQKRSDTSNAVGPFLFVFGCIIMLLMVVLK
jgi:uncharacterized membrane protein